MSNKTKLEDVETDELIDELRHRNLTREQISEVDYIVYLGVHQNEN